MTHVLRHADFRFLFLGQTASSIGERLVIVALALGLLPRETRMLERLETAEPVLEEPHPEVPVA